MLISYWFCWWGVVCVVMLVFTWIYQVAENLAQLMYSVLMTGYMFRNAQYRLELQQSVEQVALPEPQEKKVTSICTCLTTMSLVVNVEIILVC